MINTEMLVKDLAMYVGKILNGRDFAVTSGGITATAEKCGEAFVRRFFSDGADPIINGKAVSVWLKEFSTQEEKPAASPISRFRKASREED